jgi:hypothetical protein
VGGWHVGRMSKPGRDIRSRGSSPAPHSLLQQGVGGRRRRSLCPSLPRCPQLLPHMLCRSCLWIPVAIRRIRPLLPILPLAATTAGGTPVAAAPAAAAPLAAAPAAPPGAAGAAACRENKAGF